MKKVVMTGRSRTKGIIGVKQQKKFEKIQNKKALYPFLIIALSLAAVVQLSQAAKGAYKASVKVSGDWGLYYETENLPPRGNETEVYLQGFDAYFTGDTNKKVLYLTFDAGYEAGYTETILDTLAKYDVPAAFFLVGHYFESSPETVKIMAESGHIVCNHTLTHPDVTLLTKEEFTDELKGLEALAEETAGVETGLFYRPPAGKYNELTLKTANELGYKTVFWSVAYADWDEKKQPSPQTALNTLMSRVHNGAIILLHSTSKTNSEVLGTFIELCVKEGYSFESLDAL